MTVEPRLKPGWRLPSGPELGMPRNSPPAPVPEVGSSLIQSWPALSMMLLNPPAFFSRNQSAVLFLILTEVLPAWVTLSLTTTWSVNDGAENVPAVAKVTLKKRVLLAVLLPAARKTRVPVAFVVALKLDDLSN